jgi:hypothetical protein
MVLETPQKCDAPMLQLEPVLVAVQSLSMCGRYRLSRSKAIIAEHFDTPDEVEWSPRYNIAPAQPVAVVRQNPERTVRHLSLVRWGLKYCNLVSAASALRDSGSF